MTTFAPDMTPRYKASYISAGLQHSSIIRVARGSGATPTVTIGRAVMQAVTTALAALLPTDFHFTGAAYCLEDTNVFLPTTFIPANPTGLQDLADYSPTMRATETIFQGNGGGHRVTVNIFGVFWQQSDPLDPSANGRVETTEDTHILAAVTALNGATGQTSIANIPAIFSPYANIKVNDYWLKRVRKLYS